MLSKHLSIIVNSCPSQMRLWHFLTLWGNIEYALSKILKDIVRRFQDLSDRRLSYIPG